MIVPRRERRKKHVSRTNTSQRKNAYVPNHVAQERPKPRSGSPRSTRSGFLPNPRTPPTRRLSLHHKQKLSKTSPANLNQQASAAKKKSGKNSHGFVLQSCVTSRPPKERAPTVTSCLKNSWPLRGAPVGCT